MLSARYSITVARSTDGSGTCAVSDAPALVASMIVILGLRPAFSTAAIVPSALWAILRGLFSPVGLAAALPIVAMAIFVTFFVDNNIAYRSLVDGPAGRWLARLDLLPSDPAPGVRSKSQERIEARSAPSRTADAAPQPATLSLREIQTEVVDADTILLEYALGEKTTEPQAAPPFARCLPRSLVPGRQIAASRNSRANRRRQSAGSNERFATWS